MRRLIIAPKKFKVQSALCTFDMLLRSGVPVFKPDPAWPVLPPDWSWGQVIGIFADAVRHPARYCRVARRPDLFEAAFSLGFSHDGAQTYLYVADGGTHVITVLRRSDLEVVDEFGGPGVGARDIWPPHNLSVDPSGNIFVAEAAGPSVKNPTTGASVNAGFRAQKFTFTGTKPAK